MRMSISNAYHFQQLMRYNSFKYEEMPLFAKTLKENFLIVLKLTFAIYLILVRLQCYSGD